MSLMWQNFVQKVIAHKWWWLAGAAFVLAVLAVVLLWRGNNHFLETILHKKAPAYEEAYVLVNDKVSQGANITINVPPFATKADLQVHFEPDIKGDWLSTGNAKQIIFKPSEPLTISHFYLAVASSSQGVLSKDFQVVDMPKLLSVLPGPQAEAPLASKITFVFNRPIVPLSTLQGMEQLLPQVEIIPATKGKFKWISTRTLQFTPDEQLVGSANYVVKLKEGLVSQDNLAVPPAENWFTSLNLRYSGDDGSTAKVNYNKPLLLHFNQAVDLARTLVNIKLNNLSANADTKFIAQYGTKTIKNKAGKDEQSEDKSVIEVYNEQDRYGRKKIWDFNNNYELSISEVYPVAGNINLSGGLKINFSSSDVLANLTVDSPRSSNVSVDLFDPQGKVQLYFHEPIDLAKSKITSDKLVKVEYGKKCLDDGQNYGEGFACTQVDDQEHLILSFAADKIAVGEVLSLDFAKLVNLDGLTINHDAFSRSLASYKQMEVMAQDALAVDNVDPSYVYVCTNNPLAAMPSGELTRAQSADFLQADNEAQLSYWNASRLVPANKDGGDWHCPSGRWEAMINWALLPQTNYKLQLKVVDEFGQNAWLKLAIKSGNLPVASLNFFHYQASNNGYNVTTPQKTELTYATVNMDYVDINFCQLPAEQMLYYLANRPEYSKGLGAVTGCLKSVNKRLDLPKKYWLKNYFKLNLRDYVGDTTGHWLITFSNPSYVDNADKPQQVFERTYLTVTNLSLVGKWVDIGNDFNQDNLKNLYWVTRLSDLSPVTGATVKLWDNKKATAGSGQTDAAGVVQIAARSDLLGATVAVAGDSALLTNQYEHNLSTGGTAYNNSYVYLYTDRPIYRPGQTIYYKAIWRAGYDGRYDFVDGKKVKVTAYGPAGSIYEQDLQLSPFGTLSGEFVLPADAPLGGYGISTDGGGYFNFDVEEYSPAGFKVEAKTDKEEYLSGEAINLDLAASYYFGSPLESGTVEYSLGSQNYYFDRYQDEYFSFGSSWYYCPDCGYGDRFVLRGKAQLDSQGKVKLSQAFDINKLFKADEQSSKLVNFYYTITNSNGQSISGQRSVIVHAGQFYVGLKSSKDFVGKNETFQLKAKTVDIAGKPLSVNALQLVVSRVKWVENKRQEVDGGYYYNYERQLEKVSEKNLSSDGSGNWSGDMALDKEGEYELELSGIDAGGRRVKANYNLYVYGVAQVAVRPTNDQSLEVTTDKSSLRAGETAKILIKSPYTKAKALVTIERGKIYDYKIIDINQNLTQYELPVVDSYAPQVYVSVVLVADKPDVKYGTVNFTVNSYKNNLQVSVKADKDHYLPGENVNLTIEARDVNNAPVQAELSVAVADLSVLALSGNPKKNPNAFFYSYFPLNVSSGSNLKDLLLVADVPTGGKGGDGANAKDLDKKKRGEFRDTAFWSAKLLTNEQGQATASFKLPDNLTTWQIESLGLTKDLKLGVNYQEFTARKDLMAVPLKPRFIVAGDEFMLGAKVVNQTTSDMAVKLSLASDSLELVDREQTINLAAGAISNVYFKVKAPLTRLSGQHSFTIAATANDKEDTVESVIPIVAPTTFETTATAGYSEGQQLNEYFYLPAGPYAAYSQLKINSSATLAVYLNSALNYLASYPYGCSEQIAAKLRAMAIAKEGLKSAPDSAEYKLDKIIGPDGQVYTLDKAIEIGLAKLIEAYRPEQGFAYFAGGEPNFTVNLAVTRAFLELKRIGVVADADLISLAKVIESQLLDENFAHNKDRIVFGAQVLNEIGQQKLSQPVLAKLLKIAADKQYLVERASNLVLIALSDIALDQPSLKKALAQDLNQLLDNRLEIDSRGAFLKPNTNWSWSYYEDDVNDTAQYLSLITKQQRVHPLNDSLWRWLLRSRDRDGAWGSTNNTMAAVKALAAYLDWKQEAKSDLKLDIAINNQVKETRSYAAANILTQNSTTWYGSDFTAGALNKLAFIKTNNNALANGYYYDMAFKYYVAAETIGPRDEGFVVNRNLYSLDDKAMANALTTAKVGEVLKARLEIIVGENRHNVSVESFIPAGFELVNFNLATENSALRQQLQQDRWSGDERAENFWPDKAELRDDRVFLFREDVSAGTYYYEYYLRALVPGKFNHLPAVVQEMYFPENFGRSNGGWFEVK